MIRDDFHAIPASTALGSSVDYEALSGTGMTFVPGTRQDIELSVNGTTNFGNHVTAPLGLHQSVEIKSIFGTSLGSTSFTGVFARYIDGSNYVLARINHNTRQAELIERIAGSNTTLISLSLTAGGSEIGASIRLELVGQRARLFFEPHYRAIQDMPPDAAANLAGTYGPDLPGKWGLYMASDSGSATLRIAGFAARDLPSVVMPAPSLLVESATGYRFSPLSASVTGVAGTDVELEWEVYAADADDWAEAYKDRTIPTVTSRVFWVRQGFGYYVRVRAIAVDGTPWDWEVAGPTLATGSKLATGSSTLPDETFPDIIPSYVLRWEPESQSNAVVGETGRARVSASFTRPRNKWGLVFENRTREELIPLRDFFKRMRGMATPFQWEHPISGTMYAVRFQKDDVDFAPMDQVAWAINEAVVIATLARHFGSEPANFSTT